MGEPMLERIAREAGVADLVEILAERLAPSDLTSLLLAVARRRTSGIAPAEILRRYRADRLCRPADVDPARLDALQRLAASLLPDGFELVELSPLCPLGTTSVLAGISQDRVVSAGRGCEVVSDPTAVLALECALRRRRDRAAAVRLAAGIRTVRTPPPEPPLEPHFRLFALVTAARAGEEEGMLAEQVAFYERLVARAGLGAVEVDRVPRKQAYYAGATFGVSARGRELAEGGFVRWTQTLLGDRRERLLISGVGLDVLARIEPV